MKPKTYLYQYVLFGMEPSEEMEFSTEGERDTVAGKIHNVLGPIIKKERRWTVDPEDVGSSLSATSVQEQVSGQKLDTMTAEARKELRKRLDALDSGESN